MSSSATYTFKWNMAEINALKRDVIYRTLNLGYGIAAEAQRGAPVASSALINTIRATTNHKDMVHVLAGGSFQGYEVPYARRREYENNLHPNKKYFMKNAFAWGENNYLKYYKGLGK